jgi:hypothetical protein
LNGVKNDEFKLLKKLITFESFTMFFKDRRKTLNVIGIETKPLNFGIERTIDRHKKKRKRIEGLEAGEKEISNAMGFGNFIAGNGGDGGIKCGNKREISQIKGIWKSDGRTKLREGRMRDCEIDCTSGRAIDVRESQRKFGGRGAVEMGTFTRTTTDCELAKIKTKKFGRRERRRRRKKRRRRSKVEHGGDDEELRAYRWEMAQMKGREMEGY